MNKKTYFFFLNCTVARDLTINEYFAINFAGNIVNGLGIVAQALSISIVFGLGDLRNGNHDI